MKVNLVWFIIAIILGLFLFTEVYEPDWTIQKNRKFWNQVEVVD